MCKRMDGSISETGMYPSFTTCMKTRNRVDQVHFRRKMLSLLVCKIDSESDDSAILLEPNQGSENDLFVASSSAETILHFLRLRAK